MESNVAVVFGDEVLEKITNYVHNKKTITKMKIFIIAISIVFTFFSEFSKLIKKNNSVMLHAKIIAYKSDTLRLKTFLTNSTSDTIKYLSMSCSWWQFYKFSSKNVRIRNGRCDSNIPTLIEVPPYQAHTDILDLKITNKNSLIKDGSIKIAFLSMTLKNDNFNDLFKQYEELPLDSNNLIWTDRIVIE